MKEANEPDRPPEWMLHHQPDEALLAQDMWHCKRPSCLDLIRELSGKMPTRSYGRRQDAQTGREDQTERILEHTSAEELLTAAEDNRGALWSLFARLPGAELHDGPDGLWVVTDRPFPVFNTLHRCRVATEDVDAAIDAAKARARARGVPLMWFVGPSTRPRDLGTTLQAHGFIHREDWVGMAMDLSQLPDAGPLPPGVEITEAIDEQDLRIWCRTMVGGFRMSEAVIDTYVRWLGALTPEDRSLIHLYIGWLDGVAVASHLLVLAAGVAGIHFLATLPAARGRGGGSAICLNTPLEGRARGYEVGVTEVEPMAIGLCHKLGFSDYYTASTFIWRDEGNGGGRGGRSWTKALSSALRRARAAMR
jgi:hypothetical protein